MRRFSFAAASLASAALALLFCACSSVPDITFGPDDAAPIGSDGGKDAPADTTVTDAPKDVVGDCKATGPEVCDDGIDNDCDGDTDCADSECKPITECVDPAPAGWTLISFADATRPPCATGYENPVDLKTVNGSGLGNCSCACDPTAGTACSAGSFSVEVDTNNCGSAAKTVLHKTSCTALANAIAVPGGQPVGAAQPPTGPSACGPTVTPAAGVVTDGRACTVAAATKFGKGCTTATQLCAPKATGFTVCIAKLASDGGADACPAPYTKLKTAGTTAVDTRACNTGSCTCEVKACAGSVELFEANDCTTGANKGTTGALDTSCTGVTNKNFTATHYKSTLANPTNGCGIVAGFDNAMTGAIQWTDQRTVCCK